MQSRNDDIPHSIAFWLHWEIHERKPNGQLSGSPKNHKDYNGVLHCKNKIEANNTIQEIINRLTEDLKQCQMNLNQ